MKNIEENKNRAETRQDYVSPAIEIIEVKVEKGFFESGGPGDNSDGDGWG